MQGFDNVCNAVIIGMSLFVKQFGQLNQSTGEYYLPARYLGGWQGATQAACLIGAFAAGYSMEMIGRKKTILVGCMVSCIGVGVQYAASDWQVYFAGKFVNGALVSVLSKGLLTNVVITGLAIGVWFTAAPTWIGENARPECRGLFLCLYNSTIVFGQALVSYVDVFHSLANMDADLYLPAQLHSPRHSQDSRSLVVRRAHSAANDLSLHRLYWLFLLRRVTLLAPQEGSAE